VIRLFLFLILIQLFNSADGQDVLKFSVTEAKEFALQNNRAVKSARIDIGIADKKIKENLATGLPQVSLDANYLHQFVIPELSFGPFLDVDALPGGLITGDDIRNAYVDSPAIPLGVKDNATIDFTVSQLVFSGQYFIALKTAQIVRQLSEKTLTRAEDQVKEDIAVSYFAILVMRENLRLLNDTREILDQMYEETAGLNSEGLNEETDVDQAGINRSNVTTLITSLESQTEIAMKQFKYLLGVEFSQDIELTDSLESLVDEGNLRYLAESEFDVRNSIDFQLVDLNEDVTERLVSLERAKYLPVISAFYRHQEQTNQPAFNFAVKDVVGATFNLPIFSSGIRSAKVSQAKFDLQKSRLSKLDTELGLIMEYETARNNYQTAWSNFSLNRESVELSKKIYERTVIKFREGVTTSFELTQMQNQFLAAESKYYNSLLDLLRSKAGLDRILRID
jgi:outer membrane protein